MHVVACGPETVVVAVLRKIAQTSNSVAKSSVSEAAIKLVAVVPAQIAPSRHTTAKQKFPVPSKSKFSPEDIIVSFKVSPEQQ